MVMSESQPQNTPPQPANVSSVIELAEPVLKKLHTFNPGASYQPEDIKQTIRRIIHQGKIDGLVLSPDQNRFKAILVESDKYKLLVAHCCKIYVDLVLEPRFPHLKRKRIPKEQKDFARELENEIYQLENGDAAFGA
jgi:hypothetical protein